MSKKSRGTTADANKRRESHQRKERALRSGGQVRVRQEGKRVRYMSLQEACRLRDAYDPLREPPISFEWPEAVASRKDQATPILLRPMNNDTLKSHDDEKVVHFHEQYPFGAPALRSVCGELMAVLGHECSFEWNEVTCLRCLAKLSSVVVVGGPGHAIQ